MIPCRNAEGTLNRQLGALLKQTIPISEVLVVDNGSTDRSATVALAWRHRGLPVHLIEAPQSQGVNAVRNVGVQAAQEDFVLLCDADDEVSESWAAGHLARLVSGTHITGGGLIHRLATGMALEQKQSLSYNSLREAPYATGANIGFHRHVWRAVGGFDESLYGGGDEIDFCWSAQLRGYQISYAPNAFINYYQRESSFKVAQQYYSYGAGHVRLAEKWANIPGTNRPKLGRELAGLGVLLVKSVGWALSGQGARRIVQALSFKFGVLTYSLRRRKQ